MRHIFDPINAVERIKKKKKEKMNPFAPRLIAILIDD